jgi:hypothetical protein
MSEPSDRPSAEPSAEISADPAPIGRRNPCNLVPGIKAGQERGPDGKLRKAALATDVEDEYAAMLHVYTKPTDRTYQHKNLRRLLEASPVGFYDRMMALKPKEKGDAVPAPHSEERDAGTERVMELLAEEWKTIEGLLGEAKARGQ